MHQHQGGCFQRGWSGTELLKLFYSATHFQNRFAMRPLMYSLAQVRNQGGEFGAFASPRKFQNIEWQFWHLQKR